MYRAIVILTSLAVTTASIISVGQAEDFYAGLALERPSRLDQPGSIVLTDYLVRGQDSVYSEPLTTDRPDFTESSNVVGRGVLQVEMGYTFIYDDNELDDTLVRTHSGPETLFRYGVTEAIELRLAWNYAWQRTAGASITRDDGADDLDLGTKIYLTEQACLIPETSALFGVSVPTGARTFSNRTTEFGAMLLFSWELPNEWSFGGLTGYATGSDVTMLSGPPLSVLKDRHNVFSQSVVLGIPLTEKTGFYTEYFGFYFDELAVNPSQHFINGGLTYLLNYNVQFDVRVGAGLNDASEDFFTGVGLVIRH